ncbi:MAG: hypothetical protein AAFQ91_18595 [Cyanobacteria bacterium J06621_15]
MMKFNSFNITKNLLLAIVGLGSTFSIATPSTLAEPPTVQINPEVLRDTPIIRRDIRIITPHRKICGYRSERQCKEWLKRLREIQEVRTIKKPEPQPDPSPIRIAPNLIKTQ